MSTNPTFVCHGQINYDQLVQIKKNLRFDVVCECSDDRLETYSNLFKHLAPYTFQLRSSEENFHIVASGCFSVDSNGRALILFSRRDPKGTAEVSDIATMLQYCNVVHEDGGKLMWVEGLDSTVSALLEEVRELIFNY